MVTRFRGPGRRADPRRRFRNRLLVGMVAVALLPLIAFAILAVFELDAVSRSTAEVTQSAILQDQLDGQKASTSTGAQLLDGRADRIDSDLFQLVAAPLEQKLAATPTTTPPPSGLSHYLRSAEYSGGAADPTTLLVTVPGAPSDGRFASATSEVVGQATQGMVGLRRKYPEIAAVWIADMQSGALRSVPGFDIAAAVDGSRLDLARPRVRAGVDVFTASVARVTSSPPGSWIDPGGHSHPGHYWTDPYPLFGTGVTGVSVWLALGDQRTLVGADILMSGLVDAALTGSAGDKYPTAAYPLLLSSSGVVMYAGLGIGHDFGAAADPVGASLKPTADQTFNSNLSGAETAGRPVALQTHLSGAIKDFFTSPVYAGRWLWARTVPASDLEPDLTSLTLGVTTSVHRLFPVMVLPVLFLLLGLAFVAATLLSRRMDLPVRALTDHAVLEERTRLAREIHDTLAQQLTGIVLELEAADALIERGSDKAGHAVEVARNLARSALQEARRSVWNLRPATLAATGVTAAVSQEVESWEERTGIAARFRARSVPPRPALQPIAEVALLRIVQEALTNVSRHSAATAVDVSMRASDGELVLTVHDNGVGYDPMRDRPRSDCFGLEGMRERAQQAGGTLTVVGSPSNGTTVTARVPLTEAAAVADTA